MVFHETIRKLLNSIKEEGTADFVMIETLVGGGVTFPLTEEGINKAVGYSMEVDDVIGVRAMKPRQSIGWFGIEPTNFEPLDIIYDYYSEDESYCKNILSVFHSY